MDQLFTADDSESAFEDATQLSDFVDTSNEAQALFYEDVWNESFKLTDIDLTSMQGDFASLSFDYFAETFFYIDTDGSKYSVNDYVSLSADWQDTSGKQGDGLIMGQWNDYNQDGTCIVDEDGDGFIDPINETFSLR